MQLRSFGCLCVIAAMVLVGANDGALGRELRDYSPFTQFSPAAANTLSPGTELAAAATLGETSKPLLIALQQRFQMIHGQAPTPSTPFTSFALAATEGGTTQPSSNIWIAGSKSWLKNTNRLVDYAGDQTAVTVGTDHKFTPDLVIGVSASHENLALSTYFNQGRIESNGATVSPYLVWTIGGPFSLDAAAAYTHTDIKQVYAPAVERGGVHAKTRAHRGLFAGNLNYTEFVDSWIVGGKAGTLLVSERVGSYTDTAGFSYQHQTNTLGQLQVGPNIGRFGSWGSFGLSAAYLYDYNHLETVTQPGGPPAKIDRDGVLLSGNVSTNIANGIALNVTVSREVLRDNVRNTNVAAMLAVSF